MYRRKNKPDPAEWFCIAVFTAAALYFFCSIYPVMFGTHDDMRNYTLVRRGELIKDALLSAKCGRISHLWNHLLLGFPFILNRVWFYKLVSYSTVLFDVGAMMYFCIKHINRHIAWLSGAAFMAFATISSSHNLFISYALCHQLPIGLFFISLHLFIVSFSKNKWRYTALSCLLYLICCMIYEAFLPFLIVYAAAAAVRPDKEIKSFFRFVLGIVRAIIPLTVTALAYLCIYKLWQHFYPPIYEGTEIYLSEPFVSLKAFFTFPFAIFAPFHAISVADTAPVTSLDSISLPGIVKAALIAAAAAVIIPKTRGKMKSKPLVAVIAVGVFVPNLLTSVSKQHLADFKNGVIEYVTSYYSYFFVILFIVTAACVLYDRMRNKNLRIVFLSLVCCGAFGSSIIADMTVEHWKMYYSVVDRRCSNFDRAASSEKVTDCDKNWQIYAPDNEGINLLGSYTLDYIRIYDDTPAANYTFEPDTLSSELNTLCMRSDKQYLLMTAGEVDDEFRADELTIITSLPDSFDITLCTDDGREVTFTDVTDGDVISSGADTDFDMTKRPEAAIVK